MTPEHPASPSMDTARQFLNDLLFYMRQFLVPLEYIAKSAESGESEDLPTDARALLAKWQPTLDAWKKKLQKCSEQIRHTKETSQDWEALIIQLGQSLEGVSEFNKEALTLRTPDPNSWSGEWVGMIQRSAEKLDEIQRSTKAEELKNTLATTYLASRLHASKTTAMTPPKDQKSLTVPDLIDRLMNERNQPPPSLLRSLPRHEVLDALLGMLDKSLANGIEFCINGEYLHPAGQSFGNAQVTEATKTALKWMRCDESTDRRRIALNFLEGYYLYASANESEVNVLYADAVRCKPSSEIDPLTQGPWDYVALIQALMWANTWVRNQEVDAFLRNQAWLRESGWLNMVDTVVQRRGD